jgi:hypothetical protein
MAIVLVVTNPFGGLSHGDRITDPSEIDSVLAGENAHHVVQADHADVPAPRRPRKPANNRSNRP